MSWASGERDGDDEMIVAARATPPIAVATINQGASLRLVSLRDHPVAPAGLYTNRFIDEVLKGVR